jgi:hypothetical protein
MRRLPTYAWLGLAAVAIISKAGMLLDLEPFTFHRRLRQDGRTISSWTGSCGKRHGGRGWSAQAELLFVAIFSIRSQPTFEFYNLFIRTGITSRLPNQWLASPAAWSFATIWPADLRDGRAGAGLRPPRPTRARGSARRYAPFSWGHWLSSGRPAYGTRAAHRRQPSPYLAAPVAARLHLPARPLNAGSAVEEALLCDLSGSSAARSIWPGQGDLRRGLGIPELLVYSAKWIYTVPNPLN